MLQTTVHVICKTDVIKYMLNGPIIRGQIAKWAFAFSEINLMYMPLKAIKGHAIVEFIKD